MMRKTQIITYANALNMYIATINNREDLMAVAYGMELPQEYHDRINAILAETMTQVEAFLDRITPKDEEPEEPTPENPSENSDNNEGE